MTANPNLSQQAALEVARGLKLLPQPPRNFTGPQERWQQSVTIYVNRWADGRPVSPDDSNDADYTQLLEDIEVEVPVYDIYQGSGDVDDPSEATASELGRVIEDVNAIDANGFDIPGEFLFKAGEWIALSTQEISRAEDDFWQGVREARRDYEPADFE